MFVGSEDVAVGAGANIRAKSVAASLRARIFCVALVDVDAQIAVGRVHLKARIAGALETNFLLHAGMGANNFRL